MQSRKPAVQSEKLQQIADEYLGSGYDVCGEYGDGASIKRRIFDLSKVPAEYIREIPNTSSDFFSVEGQSHQEYQKDLTSRAGLSTSYLLFSASVESSYSSSELSISESGYVSIKLFMRYTTWKLQTFSQDYMYPQVIDDFKNQEGLWLIEQYGGAVLMGMDVGGQWSDNYTVSKLYENATSNVSVAMESAYGNFVSGNGSADISEAITSEESIASRRVNVVGGDPQYAPGKLDEWQASVKESPAFMNFTSDGLKWIWEIFPEHKEKLRKGFEEYLEQHKINVETKYLVQCETIEGYLYTNDVGSGAYQSLDLYKPATSNSYKYVGVNGNDNKCLIVKELATNYGALRQVTEWQQVWNDRGSGKSKDYNCWIPKAPPEYVALGVYCRFKVSNQDAPSTDEAKGMVVVHKSLVEGTDFTTTEVWKDAGSKADYDITLGRKPHNTLWPSRTTDPEAGILPSMYTFKNEYIST